MKSIFFSVLRHAAKSKLTVYLHLFLDGRDTPPRSALASIEKLNVLCETLNCGKIVSLVGRFYAMDRDKRWERTEKVYHLLTQGQADFNAPDAITALKQAYERGETDEFVKPTSIHEIHKGASVIQEGDAILFMNFRSDRARQLTRALSDPFFNEFQRSIFPKTQVITLTQYDATLPVNVLFPPIPLTNIFGEYISSRGLKQLRIAETEKYAHVTFFFNGGIETPFPNEERLLIPSPKVATYDLKPEMSAPVLTERLIEAIRDQKYDVIICNFANPDMVGHTGNFNATIKAIECIDHALSRIIPELQAVGGEALITADHGNAEMMYDHKTHQPHTAHTHEVVPLLYVGRPIHFMEKTAILADIAPTLLYLLNLPIPDEMTGRPLFALKSNDNGLD